MNSTRNIGYAVLALALVGLGFVGGWYAAKRAGHGAVPVQAQRMGGHRYTNPLLECESARDAILNEVLRPIEAKTHAKIDEWRKRSTVEHVSVYFREMNNGQSFGIHEQEKFFPASLIKLPLMLAYYKAAEHDPSLLSKRLTFTGRRETTQAQIFTPAAPLVPGRSYTVEELLRSMIVHSDNDAYYLLFASLSPKVQRAVFLDLGLEVPRVRSIEDYVTVGEYAAFFRILFNASYLTEAHSEKALEMLVEADFAKGLKAGIPSGVPVADKFGEWAPGGDHDIKQLHDCGIVYYPGQPYLLCVMSRGMSYADLAGVIGDVSRVVFQEVNGRYGEF